MAFYTGTGISEQASPVFWQVGAPRSHFGKFWTMDGHSMIQVGEISEQGSVRMSEVGDFCIGDFCICGFLFALFNETFLYFLTKLFLHFSCTFQNKVVNLHQIKDNESEFLST